MTDRTPAAQAGPVTRGERRLRLLKAALLMALSLLAFAAELLLLAVRAPRGRRSAFGGDLGGDTGGDTGGGDG
ncbi:MULTISPECIES: hypothetical protein [unclassified Streptomyces]|uniref:hypothetical protein n=1 Tax=unclassified Streptomyces TaxID=2593676 RepID=UPI0011CEBCB7|nr:MULTISPECIES: hypothetical protein [unclassified Streptomyces]TXS76850.1 hypothetical protein EAO69_10930 [Streptomyces sp. me109]